MARSGARPAAAQAQHEEPDGPPPGGVDAALSARQEGAWFHDCPVDPACRFCGARAGGLQPSPWSFLDAAYCISLQERDDRTRVAVAEMHRTGLCGKVRFYRPRRHGSSPWIGIWRSHRDVAREALARGETRVLVLEDDVRFSRLAGPRRIRAAARALGRLPQDWWIFYLGHWPLRARLLGRDVVSTTSACTHAYVAGAPLLGWLAASDPAKVMLDHRWRGVVGKGLDAAFARLPGSYALFPMLAVQNCSPSDHIRAGNRGRIRNLRHLVTRTRAREILMSGMMRPNELLVVAWCSARALLAAPLRALRSST